MPTGKGTNNFDRVRIEYFRDATVAMEAFKAGQIDLRSENIAKNWATAYDFPAVARGLVKKQDFAHHLPTGMQGYAMNTRRPLFANPLVRQAMAEVFDFEWANKNLFYGTYTRTQSYFSNSDLASSGIPQGDELKLLEPYREELPPALFTEPFKLPVTDGSGNNREQLRRALDLLQQAGWSVKERKLVDANGEPMNFAILLDEPSFERVALPYVQLLQKLGIDARVRTVDPAQYQHLTDDFDFDMIMMIYPAERRAGQRAARLLHLRGEQGAGQLQRAGHLRSGGRCAGREGGHRAGPGHADDRGARAGPGAAVGLVPGAALGQPDVPHRLLGPLRPPGQADPRRLQLRHLVGRRGKGRGDRRGEAASDGAADGHRRLDDRLPPPPPAAGDPDPVRHHRHQLRGDPVRARRPGGADDRRAARQGRPGVPAAAPATAECGGAGTLSRRARASIRTSSTTSRRCSASTSRR